MEDYLKKRLFWTICALIIISTLVFRISQIGTQSVWFDEVVSLHTAMQPLSYSLMFWDPTPPLYYFLFSSWYKLFGESLISAYFFSLICSISFLVAVVFFCKRFFSKKASILALLFCTISPVYAYYALEIRVYSLLFLFTVLATHIYFIYLETRKRKHLVWLSVASLVLIYTHIYGSIIVFAIYADLLWRTISAQAKNTITGRVRTIIHGEILISCAAIIILSIPWLIRLWAVIQNGDGTWISYPRFIDLWYTLKSFVGSLISTGYLWHAYLTLPAIFIASFFFRSKNKESIARQENIRSLARICIIIILLPFFLSLIIAPFFQIRYTTSALFFCLIVIAATLIEFYNLSKVNWLKYATRVVAIVLVIFLSVSFIFATIVQSQIVQKDNWRSASQYLQNNNLPIAVLPYTNALTLSYYLQRDCLKNNLNHTSMRDCLLTKNIYSLGTKINDANLLRGDFILISDRWINSTEGQAEFNKLSISHNITILSVQRVHGLVDNSFLLNTSLEKYYPSLNEESTRQNIYNHIYIFKATLK